ncbi:hypothetical protein GMDG_04799 [Pseudogymnoascus destructans 20631-21]|uniref:Retrotransposon gag domain-containing protein n=1 Tax=Pseudogymnoascus destructans (strain ATCC MYA-4855 / 20631-21) TaxID=658429 RepID=L8GCF1_PSED2|nr:hypothetical protein GMDG_04799 [Pseudogymnoascus destructans 20631-21]
MAWTLHKNILQDYLALAEDSNSILAEKDDAILQLQELIQSNEQQISEQQTIQKYLEKQTQQALKNEPGHHSYSQLSARIPDPPILTDGIEPAFEDWVVKICLKLEANIDHFPTQTLQMSYIQSQLGGLAQKKFSNFWKKVFSDPDQRHTAQTEYRKLYQRNNTFAVFWAEFQRLTTELDYSEETLPSKSTNRCRKP